MNKKAFTALLLSTLVTSSVYAASTVDTFSWNGTVPAAPLTDGIVFSSITGSDLTSGAMTFGKNGKLISSTPIGFKVQKESPTGGAPTDFTTAELSSAGLKMTVMSFTSIGSQSGTNTTLDPTQYFSLHADGNPIQLNSERSLMNKANVQLSIEENIGTGAKSNTPVLGENISVSAIVMVTATII